MKVWFFVLVTLVLMLAAPRAAGAGVEVTGLGGLFLVGADIGGGGPSGTLRVHAIGDGRASAGLEIGYGRLPTKERPKVVVPFVLPTTTDEHSGDQSLAWVVASLKARGDVVGGARPFGLLFAGAADHVTHEWFSGEAVHNGRFMMGLAAGVESPNRLGPAFEARAFSTGLENGAAFGFALNVGIRFAP